MDRVVRAMAQGLTGSGGTVIKADDDCIEVEFADSSRRVIYLDNLRRRLQMGDPLEQVMEEFVRVAAERTPAPVDGATFKAGLRWSLEPLEIVKADALLHRTVSKQLVLVLAWTDPEEREVQWVSERHLTTWGVPEAEAWREAGDHMSALASGTTVEMNEVSGTPLVLLSTHSVFKASLVTAPNLKACVEMHLGWPVRAVVPCRDFVYLFPANADSLIPKLGGVVKREFSESAYPLSTEVFEISDAGLKALGAF